MLYDIVRKLPEGAQVQAELSPAKAAGWRIGGLVAFRSWPACRKMISRRWRRGALPHRFRLAADDLKRIIDKTRLRHLHRGGPAITSMASMSMPPRTPSRR